MRVVSFVMLPFAFAACGGIATSSPDGFDGGNRTDGGVDQRSDGGSTSGLDSGSGKTRIPLKHRASGEVCPSARGAGS
ncbi:MAG: hypothetical protein ABI461_12675, partial [Polyangiaceae bacterium]